MYFCFYLINVKKNLVQKIKIKLLILLNIK